MPLSVRGDDPVLRDVAAHVGDEIAAQIAARGGARAIGRTKTASFDDPSPALDRLASELHATYAMSGRVRPAATGATLDVQVLTVPDGVGARHRELRRRDRAAAPTVSEVGQLVANFVRGKVGELEYDRAIAPGHVADAADLTTIGWEEIMRLSGPDDVVRARSRFREALRQDPGSLNALLGLTASFVTGKSMQLPLTAEEAAESEHALDRLMKNAANDATAALLWADLKLQEGRPELAIPSIEKAVRLSPQYANGHLMLAVALIRVGRLDDAGPELDRAIRLATLSNDQRRASTAYAAAAEIALARATIIAPLNWRDKRSRATVGHARRHALRPPRRGAGAVGTGGRCERRHGGLSSADAGAPPWRPSTPCVPHGTRPSSSNALGCTRVSAWRGFPSADRRSCVRRRDANSKRVAEFNHDQDAPGAS